MEGFIPQALSNMVYGCALLKHVDPTFLEALAQVAAVRLHDFSAQTLANSLWSFSVLGIFPRVLFQKSAEELVSRSEQLPTPDVCLARMTNTCQRTWHAGCRLEDPVQARLFAPQELSNVMLAFQRSNFIHRDLLRVLENELCSSWVEYRDGQERTVQRLDEFSSQVRPPAHVGGLVESCLMDCCCTLQGIWVHAILVMHLEPTTHLRSGPHLVLQALANCLGALAALRWYPARLLPRITRALGRRVSEMSAQELANTACE